jgi:hypothetical protein
MTRKDWDAAWLYQYNLYRNNQGHDHARAKRYADEVMLRRHGPRPDGPPSTIGIAWRVMWLLKVKKMDFKKLLVGVVGAFFVGAGGAAGALASANQELNLHWPVIIGAGIASVGVYLKEPNKPGFAHPTKKQDS